MTNDTTFASEVLSWVETLRDELMHKDYELHDWSGPILTIGSLMDFIRAEIKGKKA